MIADTEHLSGRTAVPLSHTFLGWGFSPCSFGHLEIKRL